MWTVTRRIERLVWWLRRPERFSRKLKAIIREHPVTSLQDLEQVAHRLRIEILDADLGPHIYGATTQDLGQPVIVLHPSLNPGHRTFTFAHEMGHAQLHLPEMAGTEALSATTGGIEDVEADAFALAYLMWQLPREQVVPEIIKYVRANPDMVRRGWRINQYFFFYRLRVWIANLLEGLFLGGAMKGPG